MNLATFIINFVREDPTVGVPSVQAIDLLLTSLHLPSLSEAQLLDLNYPFTDLEVSTVNGTLPNGNSSGPKVVPHLCSTFNHAMLEGTMQPEMLQATIVTLPKPGKTPDCLANFRLVSLLNMDS